MLGLCCVEQLCISLWFVVLFGYLRFEFWVLVDFGDLIVLYVWITHLDVAGVQIFWICCGFDFVCLVLRVVFCCFVCLVLRFWFGLL